MIYPEGIYHFDIAEQLQDVTKKAPPRPMLVFKGDPVSRIVTEADGTEFEEAIDRDPAYDRTIRVIIDEADSQSLDYAIKKLRAAGFTGDSIGQLNLVGQRVRVRCKHTNGENGKVFDNFDFDLPFTSTAKPLDTGMTRKLDALFGKRLKEGAAPKPAATQQPAGPVRKQLESTAPVQAPRSNNDGIPF